MKSKYIFYEITLKQDVPNKIISKIYSINPKDNVKFSKKINNFNKILPN